MKEHSPYRLAFSVNPTSPPTYPSHLFPSLYYKGDLTCFEKSFLLNSSLPNSMFLWPFCITSIEKPFWDQWFIRGGEGWQIRQFKLHWESDVVGNLPTFCIESFHPKINVKKIAQGLAPSEISIFVSPSSIEHLFQISIVAPQTVPRLSSLKDE